MNRRLEIPGPKEPLELVQRQIPEAPPKGAVVKLLYAGICHTDVHWSGDVMDLGGGKTREFSANPAAKFPMVLGHESSGEIFALGSEVDTDSLGLSVGDLVMVYPWGGCKQCQRCKEGRFSCCPKLSSNILGFSRPGGFQDFMAVEDASQLIRKPDGVPMDVASLLPCSGISAYNGILPVLPSVQEYLSMYGSASLLIVGAGGLGLWGIQIARHLMPEGTEIIVAEAFESKFDDARNAGANHTVLWPVDATVEENVAAVKELAPDGVAGAVDFVSSAKTTSSVFGCLGPMTTMVSVGLFGGELSAPIPLLVVRQNTIMGRTVGDPEHLRQLAGLVADGKVKSPPITHVKLEEANRVLKELKAGKCRGRKVIKFDQ